MKSRARAGRQIGGVPARSPVGDAKRGEHLPGLAGHFFVDPLQPLDQAADVVVAVAVGPDVVDNLDDRAVPACRAARP